MLAPVPTVTLIAGVVPPLETMGAVPVTEVTPAAAGSANSTPERSDLVRSTWLAVPRASVVTAPAVVVTSGRPVGLASNAYSLRLMGCYSG